MRVLIFIFFCFYFLTSCASSHKVGHIYKSIDELFTNESDRVLAKAVESGDLNKIKHSIKVSNNPNLSGESGVNLLFLALRKNKFDAFKLLLDLGADPNQFWESGKSTMYWLVLSDEIEFLKYAIEKGDNINIVNQNTEAALIFESIGLQMEKASAFLVNSGADLNIKDIHGQSPLLSAATMDMYSIVHLMFQKGHSLCGSDNYGNNLGTKIQSSKRVLKVETQAYKNLLKIESAYLCNCQ